MDPARLSHESPCSIECDTLPAPGLPVAGKGNSPDRHGTLSCSLHPSLFSPRWLAESGSRETTPSSVSSHILPSKHQRPVPGAEVVLLFWHRHPDLSPGPYPCTPWGLAGHEPQPHCGRPCGAPGSGFDLALGKESGDAGSLSLILCLSGRMRVNK